MKPVVLISLTVMLTCVAATVHAKESFRVELGRDGETIADMRPVFLEFESRPMPAISPMEVARRYQRLLNILMSPRYASTRLTGCPISRM